MKDFNKKFCYAKVFHKRLAPKVNQFNYNIFYLCFDISKVDDLKSYFLSINHFNLFSFYNCDHGKRDGSVLNDWVRNILQKDGINDRVKKIYLLAQPRVLGYSFKPVSFWFCIDLKEDLIAVLAEVNNTFGQNHSYLIRNQNCQPITKDQTFTANKDFYVSPFYPVKGKYKFSFDFSEKKIAVFIDYFESEKSLLTSVTTKNYNLKDSLLLKAFFNIPLMTLKVIYLIHWQALKLFLKSAKYHPKPKQKPSKLTKNK